MATHLQISPVTQHIPIPPINPTPIYTSLARPTFPGLSRHRKVQSRRLNALYAAAIYWNRTVKPLLFSKPEVWNQNFIVRTYPWKKVSQRWMAHNSFDCVCLVKEDSWNRRFYEKAWNARDISSGRFIYLPVGVTDHAVPGLFKPKNCINGHFIVLVVKPLDRYLWVYPRH